MNPYQDIFDAQRDLFGSNVTRTYDWRVEQLDQMARMIRENEERLQQAIAEDFKTAGQEYVFETLAAAAEIENQKSHLKEWMEPEPAPVPRFLAETGHRAVIYRDPHGVTLVIGPSNGPLLLLLRPAAACLAAGNTCVLALAEALTATSAVLLDLTPKYFEPRAVKALGGGKEANTELLKLPFDFIFFTGSTNVGKVVARAAAENLTPVLLELGGQNPAFVDETANVRDAAKKITWGAMAWGGQWCTSPGYAVVHESIVDDFVGHAKQSLVDFYGPDPKANRDFSNIISPAAVTRLASLYDPAKVVAGGEADPESRYLAPTIVYPVSWDDKIMDGEVFGPILPIITYSNFEDALAHIAAMPRPLAAFVFSRSQLNVEKFIGSLSYGGGAVNQVNINLFILTMPFGGDGSAGMGHYYSKFGFDQLTHQKSMLIAPPDVAIDHLFPPYDEAKVEALNQWHTY